MSNNRDTEELREAIWSEVTYILLDMDGTLLDKYFDDYFWQHLVPEKYAEKHDITFGKAKSELFSRYKRHEGTLNWTDIDFWSEELKLDIPALKEQIRHLIEVHPHVEEFLAISKERDKKIFLLTNAHYKTLKIKLRKTMLGEYFDRVITSFDMSAPKEDMDFWKRAEKTLGFVKERSLFIDDSEENLVKAAEFGIRYVALKSTPDLKKQHEDSNNGRFFIIEEFRELLPD